MEGGGGTPVSSMASRTDEGANPKAPDDDGDEDDYMKMAFDDPAPKKSETSLQRAQRLKRESRERGFVKSKAQLAQEEEAAREKALSTSLLEDPRARKSKGLAMMAKMGFTGGGLGKKPADAADGPGRTEPIKVSVKEDRGGIGLDSDKKRRLREAAEERERVSKAVKADDPEAYRERVAREREEARLDLQFRAAQRVAEHLDTESAGNGGATTTSRPLKALPVLYRGLVRHREQRQRDHDAHHSLTRDMLPAYEDGQEEDGSKAPFSDKFAAHVVVDDDTDDEELDAFNAQNAEKRLHAVVEYLRREHRYCFWCKMAYADECMDGCPGVAEEDHD